jgi:hypothetical protein
MTRLIDELKTWWTKGNFKKNEEGEVLDADWTVGITESEYLFDIENVPVFSLEFDFDLGVMEIGFFTEANGTRLNFIEVKCAYEVYMDHLARFKKKLKIFNQ